MPEEQGLEITPIIEPNDMIGIFTDAIAMAAPLLLYMAILFVPLIILKKYVDAKTGKQNKRRRRTNGRESEPDPITVLILAVKKLCGAYKERKRNKATSQALPEWHYPPNDAHYFNAPQPVANNAVDIDDFEDVVAEQERYYPRDVLTAAEFAFFTALQNVCRNYFYIAPKMGLWALVDHRDNVTAWNKISRKHLDFTLCHPQTMKPLLVIELDDSSHRNPKQQERDAEKDAILAQVGVPVLRIPAARRYDEGAIKNLISRKIKRN